MNKSDEIIYFTSFLPWFVAQAKLRSKKYIAVAVWWLWNDAYGVIERMMESEFLLDDVVALIRILRQEPESPDMKVVGRRLAVNYFALKKGGVDVLAQFDHIFARDAQLYLLVLSVFLYLFKEKAFLDRAEELMLDEALPYDLSVGIMKQIAGERFVTKEYQASYESQRRSLAVMTERLRRELSVELAYIPYEERHHRRILVATDTLLSDRHAPTQMVLNLVRHLQGVLGYEVQLLVNVEKINYDEVSSCWLHPFRPHYLSRYDGEFQREYQGCVIHGYQQIVNEEHFPQVREMLQEVEAWKPEMVWCIGGTSMIAELLGDITTMIAQACARGCAVSRAPMLLSGGDDGSSYIEEMKECIARNGQRIYTMLPCWEFPPPAGKHDKPSLGFEEDAFVIAIVGNRLDDEMDAEFIGVMREIARREGRCRFMVIGSCHRDFSSSSLAGKVKNLGYQEDLTGVLEAADLFLNPVRAGGGGSAVRAVSVGVPVITLPGCDVAVNVGDAFVCDSLGEVPDLVERYCHDRAFYQSQVEACGKCWEGYASVNQVKEYQKVIDFAAECSM